MTLPRRARSLALWIGATIAVAVTPNPLNPTNLNAAFC